MAEELQDLIERIRRDGVERADAEAERIVADARTRARELVAEAEHEKNTLLEKAKEDAGLFRQRAESAVRHAARDIILSLGEAVTETLQAIIAHRVDAAMSTDDFPGFVRDAIRAYAGQTDAANLEAVLSEKQKEAVSAFFMRDLAEAMRKGLTIGSRRGLVSGFRVVVKDSGIEHDFTGEALASALGKLLRPQLAALVQEAIRQKEPADA